MLLKGIALISGVLAAALCLGLHLAWYWLPALFAGCCLILALAAFGFLCLACALVDMEQPQERDSKFYRALIPALGETGVKCALENMFYRAPEGIVPTVLSYGDEMAEMIDRLNADAPFFCACMDFGHANLLTDDGGIAMADTLGSRIAAVHLHDNDGIDDLHASPGKGSVPWANVFGVLSDIGFGGVYNFELHDYLGADRAATVRRLSETRSALETLIKDTCRLS